MSYETIFTICNTAILLPWLLLVVAPRWQWTQIIIYSYLFPLAIAVVYLVVLLMTMNSGDGGAFNFFSLEGVSEIFSRKEVVLIGWLHYLAFDLFVGSWEVRDAQRNSIHHLLVVPCLFFTLMYGPVGLLMYMIIRFIKTRQLVVEV